MQLAAFVPATLYVIVALGEAFGFAQLEQLSPVVGVQVQVTAPDAVSCTLSFGQREQAVGVTETDGLQGAFCSHLLNKTPPLVCMEIGQNIPAGSFGEIPFADSCKASSVINTDATNLCVLVIDRLKCKIIQKTNYINQKINYSLFI